ncbi:MAG: endonuclease/exonuclease/phosphatase family protein [Pseudomonadota bacterium]|nr:endonuclease/exonuclease/phosphatase family protein [Pseudomonadota bacterium]
MGRLHTAARVVGIALAGVVVTTTVLPFVGATAWWVRIFDFPRLQIAAVGVGTLALAALGFERRDRPWLVGVGACVAWQSGAVLPFTPLGPREVEPAREGAPRLRLLVSNVFQDNRDAGLLLEAVAESDPDIFLAMETDAWWADALSPLHAEYPHRLSAPLPNTYGMILYSRLPLEAASVQYLVESDVPSVHATLRIDGSPIRLHGLHPRPPGPQGQPSGPRDAELVVVGALVREEKLPAIVIGDLNDVAWSATTRLFRKVSGTLDPRLGRGMFNSFDANNPVLRFPLDHVFHTPDFRLSSLRLLPYVGSDHFPVLAELSYEPAAAPEQPHPLPEPEDVEEAEEKIEAGFEEAR